MPDNPGEQGWERGWEGHMLAQQRRLARLPLWEKLAWLEEAQRFAEQLSKASSPGAGGASGPASGRKE